MLYPKTKSFYCFGCGASGSVIDLTMRIKNFDFAEALTYLKNLYNITETKINHAGLHKKNYPTNNSSENVKSTNAEIYKYFFEILHLTKNGRVYLLQRGLSESTLEKFKVKSIDEPKRIFNQLKKRFKIDKLKESGLVGTSKKGTDYFVFFLPAIIFIHFENNKAVYFSSRNLKGNTKSFKMRSVEQKYFMGFDKEMEIYIFESIIDGLSNYELYGDGFISVNGMNSLNIEKFKNLLNKFPEKHFIMAFDNDEAGKKKQQELGEQVKKISNFSILNWESVFEECSVENCKDMNEVLMKFNDNKVNKQFQSNENGTSNIKLLLNKLSPEQRENFEERAAIMEYDGGLTSTIAEQEAIKIIAG